MRKRIIVGLLVLLAVGLVQMPAYAGTITRYSAQTDGSIPLDATLFDLFILRPMGIAACAVGLGSSVLALPLVITTGSGAEVGDKLITEPFDYTFRRPLGFDY